jgi:hypothetical protein
MSWFRAQQHDFRLVVTQHERQVMLQAATSSFGTDQVFDVPKSVSILSSPSECSDNGVRIEDKEENNVFNIGLWSQSGNRDASGGGVSGTSSCHDYQRLHQPGITA